MQAARCIMRGGAPARLARSALVHASTPAPSLSRALPGASSSALASASLVRRTPRRLYSKPTGLPGFDNDTEPPAPEPQPSGEPEQPAATEENLKHLNEHVSMCYAAGAYREALETALMAAAVAKALFGDAHPAVASALNNLALVRKSVGEYHEAARLFDDALRTYSAVLGNEHPSTLTCMLNYAAVLRATGDLERALAVYRRVVEARRAAHGPASAEYATALSHLAGLHRERGEPGEAERAYDAALEAARAAPPPAGGERSALAGALLNNLALLLKSGGELERAEELYKQALETRREALGEEHPLYAETLHNLVELYKLTGQTEESLPLRRELARFTPVDIERGRPAPRS